MFDLNNSVNFNKDNRYTAFVIGMGRTDQREGRDDEGYRDGAKRTHVTARTRATKGSLRYHPNIRNIWSTIGQ